MTRGAIKFGRALDWLIFLYNRKSSTCVFSVSFLCLSVAPLPQNNTNFNAVYI